MKNPAKQLLAIALAWLAMVAPASAQQEQTGYFGIHYTSVVWDDFESVMGEDDSVSLPAVILRGGVYTSPKFAMEGRFALGAGSDADSILNEVEINSHIGLFAKWFITPPTAKFSPYFQYGYGSLDINTAEDDSVVRTIGIGANITIKPHTSLNVEYTSYYSNIAGLAIGLQSHF